MSVYPLMLDGPALTAVVAGGGRVAARKVRGLLAAGAQVHVVAPAVSPELDAAANAAAEPARLRITRTAFSNEHFGDALLVVAATGDRAADEWIAAGARARGRLVVVAGAPDQGNCVTPAVHRAGGVVVAVVADRVPAAASRIRNRVAGLIDDRYARAVRELSALRAELLAEGRRARWREANDALVGEDFCGRVEANALGARIVEWR